MPYQQAELHKWWVDAFTFSEPVLRGVVQGHPKIKDGTPVLTSELIVLDEDKKIAYTENTRYVLKSKKNMNIDATS